MHTCLIKGMNTSGFFLFSFLSTDTICPYLKTKSSFAPNEKTTITGRVLICFVKVFFFLLQTTFIRHLKNNKHIFLLDIAFYQK